MTGKEVAIVLGGAAIFGGTAGAGAAALGRPEPPPPASLPDTGALERRLENLEKSLQDTRRERDELREQVASLRVSVEQSSASTAAAAHRSPDDDPAIGNLSDGTRPDVAQKLLQALARVKPDGELGGAVILKPGDGHHVAGQFLGALPEEATKAALEEVNGLMAGIGRRGLSEADRWKKASEEVGVSDAQVEELKSAVADRDRALEEAFVTEKSEDDGKGGSFTLRRMDAEKAAAANRAYSERLDRTLTTDQRSKWKAGGWDHSFGRLPGGGGGAVMTIQADSVWHGTVEEEGPK